MSGVTVSARVVDAQAVPERTQHADDPLTVRATLGPDTGFAALEQRVMHCAPGRCRPRETGDCEEVLFVLEGAGTLTVDGAGYDLEPESGACLAPGQRYELHNPGPGPLRLVSVRIPEPERAAGSTGGPPYQREVVRRLSAQLTQQATTEREFRIVSDPSTGLRSATHFVGYVPTARAPEHFHAYDEVIYVLDGEGALHVDGAAHRVAPGSCLQLPARAVHCLENTGREVLRLVAVFRPAGSPAAAYYPDGTPAHVAAPRLEAS